MEPDNVQTFIEEYESLCRRTGLYVGVLTDGTMGLFRLDHTANLHEFEQTIERWQDDARQFPG